MKRFILATHAYMSKGIKSSLDLILGNQVDLSIYCVYVDDQPNIGPVVEKEIEEHKDDEFIIMTDLFGGSVNNELLTLTDRGNIHLVAGVNLVLVLSLLLNIPNCEDVSSEIRHCVEEAKSGIVYCNDIQIDPELDEL